jgi:hypothetical protein
VSAVAELPAMQDHHEQRLEFEATVTEADVALVLLQHVLNGFDLDRALSVAMNARRAIIGSHRACEQLGKPRDARERLRQLRDRGHRLLARYLSCEPIGHAGHQDVGITDQVSRVALAAALWKLSDALDCVDQQWPS